MRAPFLSLLFVIALASCAHTPLTNTTHPIDKQAFYVMGTVIELSVIAETAETRAAALKAGYEALAEVNRLMSDYDPESELSQLSTRGSNTLSRPTLLVLQLCRRFSELSGGAFDCTAGPLVDLWRTAAQSQTLPSQIEIAQTRDSVGYDKVELSNDGARLLAPKMRLDLGAIAKGFALDQAAAAMQHAGATGGRLNIGGQVLVFGTTPPSLQTVLLVDPRDPAKPWYYLILSKGSLATTADYERGMQIQGQRYSHVIDPRSGEPARELLAAVVLTRTGTSADALSTSLFVLGEEKGLALIAAEGAEALILRRDGSSYATPTLRSMLQAP
jgi:thiamine biosynthesis lipoprotein